MVKNGIKNLNCFTNFQIFFVRKRQKYPSKLYIFQKDYPPQARFHGNWIPKSQINQTSNWVSTQCQDCPIYNINVEVIISMLKCFPYDLSHALWLAQHWFGVIAAFLNIQLAVKVRSKTRQPVLKTVLIWVHLLNSCWECLLYVRHILIDSWLGFLKSETVTQKQGYEQGVGGAEKVLRTHQVYMIRIEVKK